MNNFFNRYDNISVRTTLIKTDELNKFLEANGFSYKIIKKSEILKEEYDRYIEKGQKGSKVVSFEKFRTMHSILHNSILLDREGNKRLDDSEFREIEKLLDIKIDVISYATDTRGIDLKLDEDGLDEYLSISYKL